MASTLKNLSDYNPDTVPSGQGKRIALIVAEWNQESGIRILESEILESGILESWNFGILEFWNFGIPLRIRFVGQVWNFGI